MVINGERWEYIRKHAFVPDHGTPSAVVVAIASVIGDAAIRAAWASRATASGTAKTTYTCCVVTDTALGHVSVEYAGGLYDEGADGQHDLTPTSMASWVRPLAGIVRLQLGAVYEDSSHDDT